MSSKKCFPIFVFISIIIVYFDFLCGFNINKIVVQAQTINYPAPNCGFCGTSSLCTCGKYASTANPLNPQCTACPVGYSCGGWNKYGCPAGSFGRGGECTLDRSPERTSNYCPFCPAGSYQDQANQADCKACPAGTEQPATFKKALSDCTACASGYGSPAASAACRICQAGEYANGDCVKCPIGTANPNTLQTSIAACVACGPGKYAAAGSATCSSCSPGSASSADKTDSCTPCNPGYSQSRQGQQTCSPCSVGFFASGSGTHNCSRCPLHTTTRREGMTRCISLSVSNFTSSPSSTAINSMSNTISLTLSSASSRTFSRTPVADRTRSISFTEASQSESQTAARSTTRSDSPTSDQSSTFSIPPTNSSLPSSSFTLLPTPTKTLQRIKENPAFVAFANVANSITMVAAAAATAAFPSAGFGLSRQQAKINFLANIQSGGNDCSGMSEVETSAVDSPTQMQIGSSDARYFVGGAVGNVVMTLSLLGLVQIGGYFYTRRTSKSKWKRSPFVVFARCHGSMVLFILVSMLFAPSIKFGVVVVALKSDVVVGLTKVEKAIAFVFGVVIYGGTTIYYTFNYLVLRQRNEVYRKITHDSNQTSFFSGIYNHFFEGPGEWVMPEQGTEKLRKDGKKHKRATSTISKREILEFGAAFPLIEGFQRNAWFFAFVELFTQIGLAVAELSAQATPKEKSCLTQGIVLIIVIGVHLLLSLCFRPFQERFNRIAVPLLDVFQIVTLGIAVFFIDENIPPVVESMTKVSVALQTGCSLMLLVVSIAPLLKQLSNIKLKPKRKTSKRSNKKK